jgi:hypothetical protein
MNAPAEREAQRLALAEQLRRSRAACGLPARITDPDALRRVVAALLSAKGAA